jgi:hypothetical protein
MVDCLFTMRDHACDTQVWAFTPSAMPRYQEIQEAVKGAGQVSDMSELISKV